MSKKHRFVFLLVLLVSILCLTSCKKSFSDSVPQGEAELPDMIMHDATYIFGEKDRRPLVLTAQTITIYSGKTGRTLIENATFEQEDLDGSCESGFINADNTVAKLSGSVRLHKTSDNFTIECDNLEWNDELQTISSDSEVYVVYEDGTELKAIGFYAQLDDNIYEFGQIIEGRYTDSE